MKPRKKTVGEMLDHSLGLFNKVTPEEIDSSREQAWKYLESESGDAVSVAVPGARAVRRGRRTWLAVASIAAVIAVVVFMPATIGAPAVLEDVQGFRKIEYGEIVRAPRGTGGTLRLIDGSRVEIRAQSEFWLERTDDGVRIRLSKGGVIVTAAKPAGRLYVATKEMSAAGNVFLVNTQDEGSRVAAIGGETRVQQGSTETKLLPGEQLATSPEMESLSLQAVAGWSRGAEAQLALLQQPSANLPRLAFEVTSIRSRPPEVSAGGRGRPVGGEKCGGSAKVDPRRLFISNASLYQLVTLAYGLDPEGQTGGRCLYVVRAHLLSGGPQWLESERFDIEALIPPNSQDSTVAQDPRFPVQDPKLQRMLQTMLAERFKLVLRRETREMPVYALSVAKGGPKLVSWQVGDPVSMGAFGLGTDGVAFLNATKMSTGQLASRLSTVMNRPVLDHSGIKGDFKFAILFAPTTDYFAVVGAPQQPTSSPSVFAALEQLGLTLEPARDKVEVFVIQNVEKPSEN